VVYNGFSNYASSYVHETDMTKTKTTVVSYETNVKLTLRLYKTDMKYEMLFRTPEKNTKTTCSFLQFFTNTKTTSPHSLAEYVQNTLNAIMSVRVLSERFVKAGFERAVAREMRKLQAKALQAPGYIGSVALREPENPNVYLILSEWFSFPS
jgi:hypothetical protein